MLAVVGRWPGAGSRRVGILDGKVAIVTGAAGAG